MEIVEGLMEACWACVCDVCAWGAVQVKELKKFMKKALPALRFGLAVAKAAVAAGKVLGLPLPSLPSLDSLASGVVPEDVQSYMSQALEVMDALVDREKLCEGTVLEAGDDENLLARADRVTKMLADDEADR